ncbi:MAG: type II secretion system GspH family protein [Thermoguttaceae bacterium]|nr:type II secretion system GspH family protein [Thermoguttaceae bacterium]MDW8038499.1 type II secretion system protein [Thermoguttaceae bacterium]
MAKNHRKTLKSHFNMKRDFCFGQQQKTVHRTVRKEDRLGFSVLEMLIVLTTMAILAGVALTHFQESTLDAKRSVLIHNWHVYRAQIQLYHLTHLGQYPELREGRLPQLFQATNQYGQAGPPGPAYPYGPYLDAPPINPYTMTDTVVRVERPGQKPTKPIGEAAWQYDPLTGDIWPNHPEFFQRTPGKKISLPSVISPSPSAVAAGRREGLGNP